MVPGTSLSTGVPHRQRRFGLDYFLGGVVTAGLPYQNSGTLSSGAAYDSQVARWIARYKRYGHAVEGGVRTLYYDAECCHIQGECEWTACDDIVACWVHSVVWPARFRSGVVAGLPRALRGCHTEACTPPSPRVPSAQRPTPALPEPRFSRTLSEAARCPVPLACTWGASAPSWCRRRHLLGPLRSKPVVVFLLAIAHRRACE